LSRVFAWLSWMAANIHPIARLAIFFAFVSR